MTADCSIPTKMLWKGQSAGTGASIDDYRSGESMGWLEQDDIVKKL